MDLYSAGLAQPGENTYQNKNMKKIIQNTFKTALFLVPALIFGQVPDLGTAANFVLFSSNGAMTNTGISQITGHVGTNNGAVTGFGNVNGVMHDTDGASAQAAVDVLAAYNDLNGRIPTFFPASLLGNGQILTAGVYQVSGASSLNLELTLNGQNDPDAIFIFQLQGPFSTNANSKIKLINGAKACNVFWKVEGLVDMAAGTTMRGTIIANNDAINLNIGDTLEGRALSTTGAITLNGVLAYAPACGTILNGPAAPDLGVASCYGVFSSDGPVHNSGISSVTGDVGANVGLTSGFDPLLVSGNIHPVPDVSTAACAQDLLLAYTYLNNLPYDIELLYPAQFGANLVLTPHTYILNGATTFTDTVYLDAMGNANAVFILKIYGALAATSYSKVILINGAQAENVYWMVNGAVDLGDYAIFKGTIVSQGAINLFSGTSVEGRVLTGVGALETNAIDGDAAILPADCETLVGVEVLTGDEHAAVTVFPNPFSQKITIDIAGFKAGNSYELHITSALGTKITQQKMLKGSNTVSFENLEPGVYFYDVTANGKLISSGKLITLN
ncbi:MAG: hypothetical protein K0R65_246 [Crocinitomicaceae bacterium]|jgi:hypothetical protein|nr:hypothetical protein [Crocinitomicaceae bacterium]